MSRPTAAPHRHRRPPWKRRAAAAAVLAAGITGGTALAAINVPSHPPDRPVSTDLGPAPQPIGSGGTVSWPGAPTHTFRPTARVLLPAAGLTSSVASVTRSTVLPGTTVPAPRTQAQGSTVSRGTQPGTSAVRTPVQTSGSTGSSPSPSLSAARVTASGSASSSPAAASSSAAGLPWDSPSPSYSCHPWWRCLFTLGP